MPFGISLFGAAGTEEAKKENAKEAVREWQRKLKAEARQVERNIRTIEREEEKTKAQIKAMAAQGGDPKSIQTLAKSVVRSGKAKGRLYNARAHMMAAATELQTQAATMRLSDAMKNSAEIMATMNAVVNIPETHEAMASMRQEMARAGLIEEMIDEGMADLDGPDMEEEAQDEVDKVLEGLAVDAAIRLAVTRPEEAAVASAAPAAAAVAPAARVAAAQEAAGAAG